MDYRTFILAMATMFAAGSLYGWSGLIPSLQDRFGIDASDAGMAFSFALASFTGATIAAERIGSRYSSQLRLSAYAAIAAGAMLVASTSGSWFVFLASFSIAFGFSSGAIYMLGLSITTETKYSKVLTPVMVASFGLGGAVFGPVARLSAETNTTHLVLIGLSASFTALALLCAVGARAYQSGPASAERPDGAAPASGQASVGTLWLIFFLGSAAGLMTLGLASSIVESNGASAALSSATLAGVAVANTLGRLSVAGLNRVFQIRTSLRIAILWLSLGTLICAVTDAAPMVALGLVLVALGYGTLASAVPCRTEELFGPLRFKKVYGVVFTAWGLAGFCAPWIGGALFESFATYAPVYALAFAGVMLAFGLSFIKQPAAQGAD